MVYVALLRGINVGGNAKVAMPELKAIFEKLGFENIKTFINSGNVVFTTKTTDNTKLAKQIEAATEKAFGFNIPILVKSLPEIEKLIKQIPTQWTNDKNMRCDVLFLWAENDSKKILTKFTHNPEIDDVKYITGAVVWRVDRTNQTRSHLVRIVGTPIYKQMTLRNVNTVRKLYDLMQAVVD